MNTQTAKKKAPKIRLEAAAPDAKVWWTCTIQGHPRGEYRHAKLAIAFSNSQHLAEWKRKPVEIREHTIDAEEIIGVVEPKPRDQK